MKKIEPITDIENSNIDENPNYKSFYGYFGRENDENDENNEDVIPYYTPTNIDLGDLGGELYFFKSELLQFSDKDPKKRKYGINYIDKWLFRYKDENQLGSFISFEDNRIGQAADIPSEIENLYNIIREDINNGRFIGIQSQPSIGNWISIIGKCPNKIKGNKNNNTCEPPKNDKVKVVDINDIKNDISKPTDEYPIVAIYIGTLRLDDIVTESSHDCFNNFKTVYEKYSDNRWSGIDNNLPDRESPFWKNLLDNSIADSLAYNVLNDPDTFKCRLMNKNEYKLTDNVEIPDKIYKIESNNLVEIPEEGGDSKCPTSENHCNPGLWYCKKGKAINGCGGIRFPPEDCDEQCLSH